MKLKAHKQSYKDWENGKIVAVSFFNESGLRVIIPLPTFWDATEKLVELSEGEPSFDKKAAENAIRSIL
jgi:hypothetical protein